MAKTYIANIPGDGISLTNTLDSVSNAMFSLTNNGTGPAKIKKISASYQSLNRDMAANVIPQIPTFHFYIQATQNETFKYSDKSWMGISSEPNWNSGACLYDLNLSLTTSFFKSGNPSLYSSIINTIYPSQSTENFKIVGSGMGPIINPSQSFKMQINSNVMENSVVCSITAWCSNASGELMVFNSIQSVTDAFVINVPSTAPLLKIVSVEISYLNYWGDPFTFSPVASLFSLIRAENATDGKIINPVSLDSLNGSNKVEVMIGPTIKLPGYYSGAISQIPPSPIRRFGKFNPDFASASIIYNNKTIDFYNALLGNEIVINPNESIALIILDQPSTFLSYLDVQVTWCEYPKNAPSATAYIY